MAYVAVTRARKRVIITHAMIRTVFGQRMYQTKSRFIGEIDRRFVNSNDIYSAQRSVQQKRNPQISKKIESVVGKMVMHNTMGAGVVISENENTLTVAFKKCGIKNVMRDFVKFV